MSSNVFAISTTELCMDCVNQYESTGTQNIDMVRVLYEYFFTTTQSLKEQNKTMMLSLQGGITTGNMVFIRRFLSDTALRDLHPSLIKSALIMTDRLEGLEDLTGSATALLRSKL